VAILSGALRVLFRCGPGRGCFLVLALLTVVLSATSTRAQDNYEIQVYGSELVDPGHTRVGLHSNFTIDGSKTIINGVYLNVDQKVGGWYWSLNPTLDRSFHGESVNQGVVFSPNFKFSYDFSPKIAAGLEYYGSVGPVTGFDAVAQQQHQIFPAI
jgi:hypothetical protein